MPRPSTLLLTALAPIAWGTTYIVTTELLPPGHPLFAGLLRALPAGVIAILCGRVLPRGSWWWRAGVLGILNIGAFFPLLFLAAELLPGGVAAAVGGLQPLIILGLGAAVLHERVRLTSAVAALAGTGGVALVVLGPAARLDTLGIVAAVLAIAATASGIVLTKHWGRPAAVGPVAYAAWQLTAGGLVLLPIALAFEGVPAQIDAGAVLGYVWLGSFGGLIAYVLWFRGIQMLPVAAPGLLVLLSPVVAALIGVLVAGETFTPLQAAGLAVVLIALVAGQTVGMRRGTARTASLHPPRQAAVEQVELARVR